MALSRDERNLARLQFQNKALKANGTEFETFFTDIMCYYSSEFRQVKPHGQLGDGKKDGFIPSSGSYYQVYSPERIEASDAINKLNEAIDYIALHPILNVPVKNFYYVINDRYKGVFEAIYNAISEASNRHNINCSLLLINNLEDICLSLDEDKLIAIVGNIPDPEDINRLDYKPLSEVIEHLKSNVSFGTYKVNFDPTRFKEFKEKIKLNGLSPSVERVIERATHQEGALRDYFSFNSQYLKETLQQIFIAQYKESIQLYGENGSDAVFWDILNSSIPRDTKEYKDATLVLLAYYFEACDIFESKPPNLFSNADTAN